MSVVVGAVVLFLLSVPANSLAGSYSWGQPSDFTKTSPGANPEHKYGARSWSYAGSGGAMSFSSGTWSGGGASVGVSGTQLQMVPPAGGSVSLAWASPFSAATTVTVSGSVAQPSQTLVCGSGWRLTGGSKALSSGGPLSASETVPAGGSLKLTIRDASLLYSPSCAAALVSFQITASVPAPTPTLTTPANGATITDGQPTFSGSGATGFGAAGQVTVHVYSGASATGSPTQTLSAPVGSGGSYSVGPSTPLANGTYTAVSEQDDLGGGRGSSAPNTFTIDITPPAVALDALSTKPLRTATPTLRGKAATENGASSTVSLQIYSGTSASGTPLQQLSATRSLDGTFAIQVTPALPDGQYTAIALQQGVGGVTGKSAAQTFSIKVHPPAVTLTSPAPGSKTSDAQPVFSGAAGDAFGDSPQVTVILYGGSTTSAPRLGTMTVAARAGTWSARWTRVLGPGIYTVRAKQSDDAGHTAYTKPSSFLVVGPTSAVGSSVQLARDNMASVPITCTAPAGETCTGTVEILTARSFRPSPGGPSGQVRVMFAYVSIPGGSTQTVARPVDSEVARALRRAAPVKVNVMLQLDTSSGGSISGSVSRELQAGS